jgi:lambda family phage tail tape measure protein
MPKKVDDLKILVKFNDAGSVRVIEKISNSIRHLESSLKDTKPDIAGLRAEIMNLSQKGTKNIATLNAQRDSLKALRDEAKIGSTTFKQLTSDVAKLDKQLAKTQGRQQRSGGRALATTQIAGAAISGGIFGGPEGFLGALGGGVLGGVPGAFAGAAIGAQVGIIRQSLGQVAETVAEINSMKIALAGVSSSAEDYRKSMDSVISISKQFLIPVDQSIREFTKLKAAVVGAGGSTEDAVVTFKGFAAAILATGGDAQKLSGALLAASQVFSKNKVQAEELRGQIGERLPGAFATFAQAIGVSTQELDKMLRDGVVSTENFVEFSRTLFERYSETADTLGDAPEKAGQRLELALSIATLKFGGFFQKVGAGFQNYMADLVNFAIENEDKLKNVAAKFLAFGTEIVAAIRNAVANMAAAFGPFFDFVGKGLSALFTRMQLGQREIKARTMGVNPGEIYKATLSNYKAQKGIEDFKVPGTNIRFGGNSMLTREQREEVFAQYNTNLGRFVGEESFSDIAARYRGMMDEFNPSQGLFGTSLGDPINDGNGGGGGGGSGSGNEKVPVTQRLLDLQTRLTEEVGSLTKQEELGLRHAIARMQILDTTAKGRDREYKLKVADYQFSKRRIDLDRREAEETDRRIAKEQAEEDRKARAEAQKQDRIQQARVLAGEITQEEYDRTKTLKEMGELLSDHPGLYQKIKDKLTEIATPLGKFKAGLQELIQESGNLAENLAVAGVNAISQLGEELANFVATGKADFRSLTVSILQDMARIAAQSAFTNALSGVMNIFGGGGGSTPAPTPLPGSMPTLAANGMAFAQNKIVPYAMGGVVKKPTLFQFANGGSGRLGLMGEAGPEAILPLRRGSDGKLGVEAHSGGVGNIVVNVDAKGSQAEGDEPRANMLGKLLGAAVQSELIKQKRPGGLLAS